MNRDRSFHHFLWVIWLIYVCLFLALIFSLFQECQPAEAQRRALIVRSDQWTEYTKLALMRCIVGEAGYHEADRAPIAYILLRRWKKVWRNPRLKWSFASTMYRYCHPMHGRTDRSTRVLSLPSLDSELFDQAKWDELGRWVDRWAHRQIKDPCPRAQTWNGREYKKPHNARKVWCGKTANAFYRWVR